MAIRSDLIMPSASAPMECPACGTAFKNATLPRTKRVQCPQCRQIVPLQRENPPPPAPEFPVLHDHIAVLEKQIQELERKLAERIASAQPRDPFHWVTDATIPPDFSEAREQILQENLRKVPPHRIAMEVAPDEASQQRAKWLKLVFEQAQWEISDRPRSSIRVPAKSLALVTALPVSPAMSAAYLALHASGFSVRTVFIPQGDECLIVA